MGPTNTPDVPVIGGKVVATTTPTDGQTLTYSAALGVWIPTTTASPTLAGDVTGPGSANTVVRLMGVPIANVPTANTLPLALDQGDGVKIHFITPQSDPPTQTYSAGGLAVTPGHTEHLCAPGVTYAGADVALCAIYGDDLTVFVDAWASTAPTAGKAITIQLRVSTNGGATWSDGPSVSIVGTAVTATMTPWTGLAAGTLLSIQSATTAGAAAAVLFVRVRIAP